MSNMPIGLRRPSYPGWLVTARMSVKLYLLQTHWNALDGTWLQTL